MKYEEIQKAIMEDQRCKIFDRIEENLKLMKPLMKHNLKFSLLIKVLKIQIKRCRKRK